MAITVKASEIRETVSAEDLIIKISKCVGFIEELQRIVVRSNERNKRVV